MPGLPHTNRITRFKPRLPWSSIGCPQHSTRVATPLTSTHRSVGFTLSPPPTSPPLLLSSAVDDLIFVNGVVAVICVEMMMQFFNTIDPIRIYYYEYVCEHARVCDLIFSRGFYYRQEKTVVLIRVNICTDTIFIRVLILILRYTIYNTYNIIYVQLGHPYNFCNKNTLHYNVTGIIHVYETHLSKKKKMQL